MAGAYVGHAGPIHPSTRRPRWTPPNAGIAVGESDSVDAVLERLWKADTTEADPYRLTYTQQQIRAVRGLRAWTSGRPKEALDHWDGFNRMGTWGAIWRGDAYRRLDRLEEAEQWYLAAWEAPIAHARTGRLYEEMGRLDDAASAYDRFLAAWNSARGPFRERVDRVQERRTDIIQEQQLRNVSQ